MFCPNCGNQVPDGAGFCGSCGSKIEAAQPAYSAPQQPAYSAPQQPVYEAPQPAYSAPQQPAYQQPTYQQPTYQPTYQQPVQSVNNSELDSMATNTLVFGILGLALSEIGVPGIIFSAIGKNKANEYITRAGELSGKAKVGSILAKIGLPISIVMTVIWFIYFIALMATM